MSSQSSINADSVPSASVHDRRSALQRDAVELQASPRSPSGDGVIILRVEVDDFPPEEEIPGQLGSSRHTVFLVGGGDDFQCRMLNAVAFQHCQRHGQPYAVVSPKRSSPCFHPSVVHIRLNRIAERVVHSHTHHVHVVEEHHRL